MVWKKGSWFGTVEMIERVPLTHSCTTLLSEFAAFFSENNSSVPDDPQIPKLALYPCLDSLCLQLPCSHMHPCLLPSGRLQCVHWGSLTRPLSVTASTLEHVLGMLVQLDSNSAGVCQPETGMPVSPLSGRTIWESISLRQKCPACVKWREKYTISCKTGYGCKGKLFTMHGADNYIMGSLDEAACSQGTLSLFVNWSPPESSEVDTSFLIKPLCLTFNICFSQTPTESFSALFLYPKVSEYTGILFSSEDRVPKHSPEMSLLEGFFFSVLFPGCLCFGAGGIHTASHMCWDSILILSPTPPHPTPEEHPNASALIISQLTIRIFKIHLLAPAFESHQRDYFTK